MLATGHGEFGRKLVADAVKSQKTHGIYEWQNLNHTKPGGCGCKLPCDKCTTLPCFPCAGVAAGVINYTASVTNLLAAARLLLQ